MDKRLEQIKEGAGLDESRLNEELIEFLKKHNDKFFLVILIAALGILGHRYWHQYQIGVENDAWAAYEEALVVGRPEALLQVAADHDGRPGLAIQALTDAADLYMQAVGLGLTVQATAAVNQNPGLVYGAMFGQDQENQLTEADELSDEERDGLLTEADDLYARIIEMAGDNAGMRVRALGGWFGRAAVAEARDDPEQATRCYKEIVDGAGEYVALAGRAERRIGDLDGLSRVPRLVEPEPLPETPTLPPVPDSTEQPSGDDTEQPADAPAEDGAAEEPTEPQPADTSE
ncbi:MAG: hypothetical protein KAS72_03165 [Phycisphaerales bacterium]|nr:hypothetical protein [Phycisphaerales bacterium]